MKKFGLVMLTIAIALSVIADIVWVGFYVYENRTTNISTIEVGKFNEKTIAEEDKAVLNINYYANKDKTGYEVFEIKFNSYTGVDKTKVFGYGVQYINPSFNRSWYYDINSTLGTDYYVSYTDKSEYTNYYDYSNGISYKATNNYLDSNSRILFDDDKGNTYSMQFLGKQQVEEKTVFIWVKNHTYTDYNLSMFAYYLYNAIKGNSLKSGFYDFQAVFDVSNMFKFEQQNRFGNFSSLTDDSFIDELKTFMTCKLNISNSGITLASQSMFNLVNGKNDFDITKVISTKDYFTQVQSFELTDSDFDYILNDNQTSHKAVLKNAVLSNLNKLGIENVTVVLNGVWQEQHGIVLNKNDIDLKGLNLLSYKKIGNI